MSTLDVLVIIVACLMIFGPLILSVGEDGDRPYTTLEENIALAGLLLLVGFLMYKLIW